jgi:hypothetical protein
MLSPAATRLDGKRLVFLFFQRSPGGMLPPNLAAIVGVIETARAAENEEI